MDNRFADLNITAVSTSTANADSLNLMSSDNHSSTQGNVIQSSSDNTGQHNNNNNSHMNNNHVNQGIKTENQSPPSNLVIDEQDSSRYALHLPVTFITFHRIASIWWCFLLNLAWSIHRKEATATRNHHTAMSHWSRWPLRYVYFLLALPTCSWVFVCLFDAIELMLKLFSPVSRACVPLKS